LSYKNNQKKKNKKKGTEKNVPLKKGVDTKKGVGQKADRGNGSHTKIKRTCSGATHRGNLREKIARKKSGIAKNKKKQTEGGSSLKTVVYGAKGNWDSSMGRGGEKG